MSVIPVSTTVYNDATAAFPAGIQVGYNDIEAQGDPDNFVLEVATVDQLVVDYPDSVAAFEAAIGDTWDNFKFNNPVESSPGQDRWLAFTQDFNNVHVFDADPTDAELQAQAQPGEQFFFVVQAQLRGLPII